MRCWLREKRTDAIALQPADGLQSYGIDALFCTFARIAQLISFAESEQHTGNADQEELDACDSPFILFGADDWQ